MTMPNLIKLVTSLLISHLSLFDVLFTSSYIDHSLDYSSKLTICNMYLHLLLKDLKDLLLAG